MVQNLEKKREEKEEKEEKLIKKIPKITSFFTRAQGSLLVILESTLMNKISCRSPPFCVEAKNYSLKSNESTK